MRKFELISNENNVVDATRLKELDKLKASAITNRDFFVVAYHYAQEGMSTRAESTLNQVTSTYFVNDLYRDLYHALLAWNVYKMGNPRPDLYKFAEFFIVVQRAIPLFQNLSFNGKPHFNMFYQDYRNIVAFTNGT